MSGSERAGTGAGVSKLSSRTVIQSLQSHVGNPVLSPAASGVGGWMGMDGEFIRREKRITSIALSILVVLSQQ